MVEENKHDETEFLNLVRRIDKVESDRKSDIRLVTVLVGASSTLIGVIATLFFLFIDQRIPRDTDHNIQSNLQLACDASRKASRGIHEFFEFQVEYLNRERSRASGDRRSHSQELETLTAFDSSDTKPIEKAIRVLDDRIAEFDKRISAIEKESGAIEHFMAVCTE